MKKSILIAIFAVALGINTSDFERLWDTGG